MEKYFIRFECSGGSLAVEKHLHTFIRENLADRVVSEDRIDLLVQMIEAEQDEYFKTHRGQRIRVSSHSGSEHWSSHINAGQLYISLIEIKGEI